MKSDQDKTPPPGQEAFTVDHFRPEDAEGIVRLFRAVYGEHYPIRLFYDPEAICKANEEGRYISIVARTPAGEIIGVNHLYPSAPCGSLYKSGVGLALKEYRSLGVNSRTLGYLYDEYVPRHPHSLPYEEPLRRIYGRLDDTRELIPAETGTAGGGESRVRMEVFDFTRVARIAVEEIGADQGEYMDALEREAVGRKVVVFQAWLDLAQPRVGRAAEVLRERGYFFGGALQRWFDSDELLMQKLLCPPDFEGIVLGSDFSTALLEVIKTDWQRANA